MDKVDTTVATMISRSKARLSLAVTAILIVLSTAAPAQDMDMKKGKLGHLTRLIGTYDDAALLNDPQVKQALAQVGGEDVGLLEENLAVRGPIAFIDGDLVLSGNAPHMGDRETATLWVRVYDGSVRAVIVHEGNATIYAKDSQYDYLPGPFRIYVRNVGRYQDTKPPPGVRWQR